MSKKAAWPHPLAGLLVSYTLATTRTSCCDSSRGRVAEALRQRSRECPRTRNLQKFGNLSDIDALREPKRCPHAASGAAQAAAVRKRSKSCDHVVLDENSAEWREQSRHRAAQQSNTHAMDATLLTQATRPPN